MRHRPALAAAMLALTLGAGSVVPATAFAAPSGTVATAPTATAPTATRSASYPYASSNPRKIDPWGAEIRQCTSFASWWLTSHGIPISRSTTIRGPKGSAQLLNAGHWDTAAHRAGYAISRKPVVGAIAQWHANERSTWPIPGGYSYVQAGADGHVGVVRKVFADGSALIQDYNGAVPLGLHTFRGKAPRYLLIHS